MPSRAARNNVADARGIAECVNETYASLRPTLPAIFEDWTVQTVAGFRDAGCRAWVWERASDGLILGCLVAAVEEHDGEPWLAAKVLGIRMSELPDVGDNRELAVVRALKVAVQQSIAASGTVGVTMLLHPGFNRLINFLQRKFPAALREMEGDAIRFWGRHAPGLPEITAAAAGLSD